MRPIIEVRGLSKRYTIGEKRRRYGSLRETLGEWGRAPLRALRSIGRNDAPHLWALRDVDFDIMPGEAVGIIGRNGAGKSTLLKLLTRITEPTEGEARLWGRVGSLLEVGSGFHPELSGRDNVYLNGAILGMRKAEIDRKFDEIVAFAELEKFIDTPVKHYSSGMYMRLAFSVAAHLEPEILLVDEVLAVGDAVFQEKCLGKMDDVTKQGRTVMFVSHNLGAVANLCSRAILLVEGRKHLEGTSREVLASYIALGRVQEGERVWLDAETAPGNEKIRLRAVRVLAGGDVTADVDIDSAVTIEVEYENHKAGARIMTSVHLLDTAGAPILASMNAHSANSGRDTWFGQAHPAGVYRARCTIPPCFLNEGRYRATVVVLTDVINWEASARDAVAFTVHDTGAMRQEYRGPWIGVVRPKLDWRTEFLPDESGVGTGGARK